MTWHHDIINFPAVMLLRQIDTLILQTLNNLKQPSQSTPLPLKTQISLPRWAGWSESSLDKHMILLEVHPKKTPQKHNSR